MYYGSNRIYVALRLDDGRLNQFMQKCSDIVDRCGNRPFLSFTILLKDRKKSLCTKLGNLLPLLETMRVTGFEPDRNYYRQSNPLLNKEKQRSIESGRSLFNIDSSLASGEVYARAIALGRRVRDEEWSFSKLASRFEEFVKFVSKKTQLTRAKWPATF